MPKKLKLPIDKRLIGLYEGDIETLNEFFPSVGYNFAIREAVHKMCNKLRERASREEISNVRPELDLDLSDLQPDRAGGS